MTPQIYYCATPGCNAELPRKSRTYCSDCATKRKRESNKSATIKHGRTRPKTAAQIRKEEEDKILNAERLYRAQMDFDAQLDNRYGFGPLPPVSLRQTDLKRFQELATYYMVREINPALLGERI